MRETACISAMNMIYVLKSWFSSWNPDYFIEKSCPDSWFCILVRCDPCISNDERKTHQGTAPNRRFGSARVGVQFSISLSNILALSRRSFAVQSNTYMCLDQVGQKRYDWLIQGENLVDIFLGVEKSVMRSSTGYARKQEGRHRYLRQSQRWTK